MMKHLIMIICAIGMILIGSIFISNKYKTNNDEVTDNLKVNNNITSDVYATNAGTIDDDNLDFQYKLVKSYDTYKQILLKYEMQAELKEDDFTNYDYLAVILENDYCDGSILNIKEAKIDSNTINIIVNMNNSCSYCAIENELYFIRFTKNSIKENFDVKIDYEEINQLDCTSNIN